MGSAVFWNESNHCAVIFEGNENNVLGVTRVDDPHMRELLRRLEYGFNNECGRFSKAICNAERAAMPCRKKYAMRRAAAAVLLSEMRKEGYELAKPGSMEYAIAGGLFANL